jgi:hypothetical protein
LATVPQAVALILDSYSFQGLEGNGRDINYSIMAVLVQDIDSVGYLSELDQVSNMGTSFSGIVVRT